MQIIKWILIVFVGLVALMGLSQYAASERVEVVELTTVDDSGEAVVTRLWVVDHDGFQYLRVGGDGSGWFTRLQANDTVSVTRGESTATYRTTLRPEKSDIINNLMQEKYTWGDTFIAYAVGGRVGSIAIELNPI